MNYLNQSLSKHIYRALSALFPCDYLVPITFILHGLFSAAPLRCPPPPPPPTLWQIYIHIPISKIHLYWS
jgi:hypothetical protein